MRCPADSTEMRTAEREGIRIDYCPQCRGVWLHRGALEEIANRAREEMAGPGGPGGPGGYGPEDRGYRGGPYGRYGHGPAGPAGSGPREDYGPGPGGPGEDMGGRYGGGYEGPPQGERRRSIFDIFNF